MERHLLAFALGIVVMLGLILRSKLSAFPALLLAAMTMGIVSGLPVETTLTEITTGFGRTMSSIGIIIGLGIMLGKVLEVTGAAKSMALAFLRLVGRGRERWALAAAGYVVSVPVFSDSGFILLFELCRALSALTRTSIVTLTFAMSIGLSLTHLLVPPTPGPLAVANEFGVDVGVMIFYGLIAAVPVVPLGVMWAGYAGKRLFQVPLGEDGWTRDPAQAPPPATGDLSEMWKGLPSAFASFLTIALPIALILVRTSVDMILGADATGIVPGLARFFGRPYVALMVGLVLALATLTRGRNRGEMAGLLGQALNAAGLIVFVTAGGGALGHIIRVSGIGDTIGDIVVGANAPLLLLPFILTAVLKFAQGSGTVAVLTSAAITAPVFVGVDINPVLPALSACMGGVFLSHFNDSFFWVFTKFNHITEMEAIRYYTIPKAALSLVGMCWIWVMSWFI